MRNALLLAIVAICGACSAPDQESVRTVAVMEIPLKTSADRSALVSILRGYAAADGGMHVDDVTVRWRALEAQYGPTLPGGKATIAVGVWRGANDDELIAQIDDMGHPGKAWLTFVKGEHVDRATRFRQAVLAEIARRWPDSKPIPVLPSGGVPLSEDLRLTPDGYKVDPAAAARYELPKTSPLVAHG